MKKVLLWLVILVMSISMIATLSLSGCKKEAAPAEKEVKEEAPAKEEVTEEEAPAKEEKVAPVEKKLTKLGYNILTGVGEHWTYMVKEVQEACEAEGIELMVTDANIDAEKQVADIEDMVNAGCEVIIVVSVDPAAVQAGVKYAHERGVYVIADISQFDNADAYVGFSECGYGTIVGEYVGKWWAKNRPAETAYIFESNADDLGGDLPKRTDCMVEAFKKSVPDSEVVLDLTCWLEECGYSLMEDALISHPEVNLFFGSNNECTYGAVAALEAAGKSPGSDVVFACVDNHYKMIEMIRDGKVLATAYTNEAEEGPLLVETAKKLVEGSFEIGSTVLFDTPVVNQENASEYLEIMSKYLEE